jgi:hypothetical protein
MSAMPDSDRVLYGRKFRDAPTAEVPNSDMACSSLTKKKAARGRLSVMRRELVQSGRERESLIPTRSAIRHETDACESEDHHGPCGRFGHGGYS